MHRLLLRQIQRHLGKDFQPTAELERFFSAIDEAYVQGDADRAMIERSLALASEELNSRNQQVQEANNLLEARVRDRTAELERATFAAEEASRAKSAFLATMSHEIRTPLNGVMGSLELLARTLTEETQLKFARVAHTSATILLKVISDILDFSKIEAGKLELEHVDFDLRQMLDDVAAMLLPSAKLRGLELFVEISPDKPLWARGDPNRLRQIVVNLLNNAIKFTPHGSITLRTRVETQESIYRINLDVIDTGIGIPPERMDRLFQSFSQVDSSTSRKFGGTGLGLAICRQLVKLMNGEIIATSTPGTGTTFHVSLAMPIANSLEHEPEAEFGSAASTTIGSFNSLRVLLVEDNEVNQLIASEILAQMGCSVELADNGLAAVERVRSAGEFDVILMDCQMPVMDGYEATNLIRLLPSGNAARIVALTANAVSGDREACLKAGMDDYLTKPIQPAQLFAALQRAIRCKKTAA
jgi:signal transduction histidine kinase/ActR/RegA family two-component response regulator